MNPGKRTKAIIGFILAIAAAVAIGAVVLLGGVLNKVKRVSTGTIQERIPRSEETFEATAEGPDTVQPEEVEFDVDSIEMMQDDDIRNILLIGQDAREGEERQRSDTMIICSINTHDNKVTLVSLMRDMYVPIPGYSDNRINAAYAFGGMDLLDEVIEQDFGIPIDGNVEVDFEGFVNAMSVIGGIDMELSSEEAGYLSLGTWDDQGENGNDGTWDLQPGMNTLTPQQALAFARIRYVGNSDWERTERQRRVIIAAFTKISSSSTAKLLSIADSMLPYITTDMTGSELLSYVKTLSVVGITNIDSYRLPVDGHYSSENINGMAVLVPDLVKNSELLKQYIYGADVEPELHEDEDKKDKETQEEKTEKTTTTRTTVQNSTGGSTYTDTSNTGNSGTYNNSSQQNTYVPAATPAPVTEPANSGDDPDNGGNYTEPDNSGNTEPIDPGTGGDAGVEPAADPGSTPTDSGSGAEQPAEPVVEPAPEPVVEVPAASEPTPE